MKPFDPDDPLLTAYALGELEGEELREVEALVARDPAAARHVESIRAAAAGFGEAFEREPAPEVEPIRAVEIEPKRRAPVVPWLFYASTAAAACFFVVLVIRLADPGVHEKESNFAAEVVLPSSSAVAPVAETVGAEDRAAAMEQAATDELRRQSSDLRQEGAAVAGASASVAEPAAGMAEKTEITLDSIRKRDDAYAAKPAAPPAAKLGEMKDAARRARSRENEGEMRSAGSFAGEAVGPETSGVLRALSERIRAGEMPESVNSFALLAELGLREPQESRENDLANLAQATPDQSPMPDPEAALVRAVEGFARLIAARTPATDESWDRVLADARYAAGSDPKRQAFVGLVGEAREAIRKHSSR